MTTPVDKRFYICRCQCIKWAGGKRLTTLSSMSEKIWCKYFFLLCLFVSDLEYMAINKIFTQTHNWQVSVKMWFILCFYLYMLFSEENLKWTAFRAFNHRRTQLLWISLLAPGSNEIIQSTLNCMWMNESWNQHICNPTVVNETF